MQVTDEEPERYSVGLSGLVHKVRNKRWCGICLVDRTSCLNASVMIILIQVHLYSSQLRPPMMASLLRKLVVDVPALTDNTVVALRVRFSSCFYNWIVQMLNILLVQYCKYLFLIRQACSSFCSFIAYGSISYNLTIILCYYSGIFLFIVNI